MNQIPEITITVSMSKEVKKSEIVKIRTSKDSADLLRQVYNADTFDWTEEFIILCLNRQNAVVGFKKISSGGMTGTVADPKVILTTALNTLATSIILSHNHPSGNLLPSRADDEITKKIKYAASYLDILVLDHIIITDEGYYSYADEGRL